MSGYENGYISKQVKTGMYLNIKIEVVQFPKNKEKGNFFREDEYRPTRENANYFITPEDLARRNLNKLINQALKGD